MHYPTRGISLAALALAAFAVLPTAAQAGCSDQNTCLGNNALYFDGSPTDRPDDSTAIGYYALHNSRSDNNTAIGSNALTGNTGGADNTASGFKALTSNTTGGSNTASGAQALQFNTTGHGNMASGY